jgi:hypothetical protein
MREKTRSLISERRKVKTDYRSQKGVDRVGKKKESKEESPIPMLILMTVILLGGILMGGLFIFSD